MNHKEVARVTITFAVLFVVSLGLIVGSYRLAPADIRQVLIPVGSALMGGDLAFYLVEMFTLDRASRL